MRTLKHIFFFSLLAQAIAAQDTTIYVLPGQGSDRRLFDSIQWPAQYKIAVLEYGTPEKGATMAQFARQIAVDIDTTQPFILVGTSLGGMLCVEMADFLYPVATVLISSARHRGDLPFRYRFQRKFPIYKIVPGAVMVLGAKVLQPIVEPDRRCNKATFKSMLGRKTPRYMKRSVAMIIEWNRTAAPENIVQIHGKNDHTLPFRHISNPDIGIPKGSHMMTLTSPHEVSRAIGEAINACNK